MPAGSLTLGSDRRVMCLVSSDGDMEAQNEGDWGDVIVRAGPTIVPHKRIDSSVALRSSAQGDPNVPPPEREAFFSEYPLTAGTIGWYLNVSKESIVAPASEVVIVSATPGSLMMSSRVEVTLTCRLRRPNHTEIAIRSDC